jgi:AcrR family transcriptional regulator
VLDVGSNSSIFVYEVNEDSENQRGRQSLRERLKEATGREILNAAEQLFGEGGLEQATMAQIAERAGVAVGTLYNRFADRDALVEALLAERRGDLLHQLDENMAALENEGFREQLIGFFTTLFTHMDAHRPFLKLVFSRELGAKEGRERMARGMFDRLESILKRGHREKILKRDADHCFAIALFGAAKGNMQRDAYGLAPLAPHVAARAVVSLFLDGAVREER